MGRLVSSCLSVLLWGAVWLQKETILLSKNQNLCQYLLVTAEFFTMQQRHDFVRRSSCNIAGQSQPYPSLIL